RIGRTEEWMCSQVLFTGKCEIEDFDTGRHLATLDYGQVSTTIVDPPWTDPASRPLDDLKLAIRHISSASNNLADVVIFGSKAANLFENNESVQMAFDRRFIMQGELTPRQREWGLTELGTWRGLNLLVTETTYVDKTGETKSFVPEDAVLVACSVNQGLMAYAAVAQGTPATQQLDLIEGRRVPLAWLPDNEDVRKLRLSSRPCPVPPDSANWSVIKVK